MKGRGRLNFRPRPYLSLPESPGRALRCIEHVELGGSGKDPAMSASRPLGLLGHTVHGLAPARPMRRTPTLGEAREDVGLAGDRGGRRGVDGRQEGPADGRQGP